MLKLQSLPAGEGDALWIEWGTDKVHRMIIDMGRASCGKRIRSMLKEIPEDERVVELLIVTHVDRDHIEGVLSGFAKQSEDSGTKFKSIWFNGWNHLHGLQYTDEPPAFDTIEGYQTVAENTQMFGAVQGELLSPWVANSGVWNSHFDGCPVIRPEEVIGDKVELKGGLSIRLLGPTQSILHTFIDDWRDEILELEEEKDVELVDYVDQRVGPGVRTFGREKPAKPTLSNMEDLIKLADSGGNKTDNKPANGSSICIVLEYQNYRLLLTGDAHPDNLLEALSLLSEDEAKFDLVKLPHHGSKKNVTTQLIKRLDCDTFLISTSGSHFYHPDSEAIARVIGYSVYETPTLLFNVRSEYNEWWDNQEWISKFGYKVSYGDDNSGLTVTFD